jgi:uncharacterized protein (TIRG00374 family)
VLRRWILWTLVVGFVWAVFSRLPELERLGEILAGGRWPWILAGGALQALYYTFVGLLYQAAFLTVGIHTRAGGLLVVLLASLFVNTMAPSGGMAGAALFVDEASRRGLPGARAAAAVLLSRIADSLGFTVWMLAGLSYLFLARDLRPYEIAAASALLVLTAATAGLLVLGLARPRYLRQMLGWFARVVNRVLTWSARPAPLDDDWADRHADEFAQAGVALGDHPQHLIRTIAIALMGHLFNVSSLAALFAAFRQPVEPGLVIAVYTVGILFWKMSPVPEGVGVVEGVMVLAMTSVGVPAPNATVIALSFRGLSYWLPMVTGFLLLRRLHLFRRPQPARPAA